MVANEAFHELSESHASYLDEMCCRLSIILIRQNAWALLTRSTSHPWLDVCVHVCVGGMGAGCLGITALVVEIYMYINLLRTTPSNSSWRWTPSSHIPTIVRVPSKLQCMTTIFVTGMPKLEVWAMNANCLVWMCPQCRSIRFAVATVETL